MDETTKVRVFVPESETEPFFLTNPGDIVIDPNAGPDEGFFKVAREAAEITTEDLIFGHPDQIPIGITSTPEEIRRAAEINRRIEAEAERRWADLGRRFVAGKIRMLPADKEAT